MGGALLCTQLDANVASHKNGFLFLSTTILPLWFLAALPHSQWCTQSSIPPFASSLGRFVQTEKETFFRIAHDAFNNVKSLDFVSPPHLVFISVLYHGLRH